MKQLLAIFLTILLAAVAVDAQHVKSTRQIKQPRTSKKAGPDFKVQYDTLCPQDGDYLLTGYDKPLNSPSETFFLTNLTDRNVSAIVFTIEYYDSSDRLIHRQTRRRSARIPPHETRKVDFPTWDRQGGFYYIDSRPPRVSAVPYDVKIAVDTLYLAR